MFTKVLSMACLIFLFAVQASAQTSQVPSEQETDRPAEVEQTSDEEQGNSEPAPATPLEVEVEPVQPVSNGEADEGSEQVADNIFSWLWNNINITNSLIVLFTFFLVLFTRKLSISTEKLWKTAVDQGKSMQASIDQAARAADAMQNVSHHMRKSAAIARENTDIVKDDIINTRRAFVSVASVGLTKFVDKPGDEPRSFGINVKWVNRGQTPTRALLTRVNMQIAKETLPENFDFPDFETEGGISAVLGPQAEIGSEFLSFSLEEAKDIRSGAKHMYIWGWAEYNDVLKNTRRHRFEFCYSVFIQWADTPKNVTPQWGLYKQHNGEDDECMKPVQTSWSPK